jgi:hypothetical protein
VPLHAQRIIDVSPSPGLILNREGTIVCANPAFTEMFGLDNAESPVGRSAGEFLHVEDDLPQLMEVVLTGGNWSGLVLGEDARRASFYLSVRAKRLDGDGHGPLVVVFASKWMQAPGPSPAPEDAPDPETVGSIGLIGGAPALDEVHRQLQAEGFGCDRLTAAAEALVHPRRVQWDVAAVEILPDDADAIRLLSDLCSQGPLPRTVCLHSDIPSETAMRLMRMGPDAFCHLDGERADLPATIRRLTRASRFHRFVHNTSRVLRHWLDSSETWKNLSAGATGSQISTNGQWYLEYAHAQIHRLLGNVRQLAAQLLGGPQPLQPCEFFRCPRLDKLIRSTEHTVEILEKTRNSFKSKELGNLRKALESTLKSLKQNDLS